MKKLIFALILIAAAPFSIWYDGAILKDTLIQSETLEIALLPTSDRKCKTTNFVFHQCSYKYETESETKRQAYVFLGFTNPEQLILLRSKSSGTITSNAGQDYLWNRILTPIIILATGLAFLSSAIRGFNGSNQSQLDSAIDIAATERFCNEQTRGERSVAVKRSSSIDRRAQGFGRRGRHT